MLREAPDGFIMVFSRSHGLKLISRPEIIFRAQNFFFDKVEVEEIIFAELSYCPFFVLLDVFCSSRRHLAGSDLFLA